MIAPDSFKGSLASRDVAYAIADGWNRVRPEDRLFTLPMADGGEGTLDVVSHVRPDSTLRHTTVTGPHGAPVEARWLQLSDSTAVIEMAQTSGLPLMDTPDPIGATSRGLGELIAVAIDEGAERILVALGGSATTDAGLGALEGLGAVVHRDHPEGRGALGVTKIDPSGLPKPPREGITVLTDTKALMLEAPTVFGPQKGASPSDVEGLTDAFSALQGLSPVANSHRLPGSGAAGATAWGLASFMGAVIVDGARYLGNLLGAGRLLQSADLLITGEGRFDQTSLSGKVVGYLHHLAQSYGVDGALIVGTSDGSTLAEWPMIRLIDQAQSLDEAMAQTASLAANAGEKLANQANEAGKSGWGAWTRTKNN